MFQMIWPIAVVVLSNTVYQVCSKGTPQDISPFASLTVTYAMAAVTSLVLYYVIGHGENILQEYGKLNWAPFVLGIVIVGLEIGFIYAYRAGWQVSTASLVANSVLSVVLLILGFLAYHEALTWNKLVGAAIILAGLYLVNMK